MDLKAKIEAQRDLVKAEFEKYKAELVDLGQRRSEFLSPLDQRVAVLREELVRLQGDFRSIAKILDGGGELKMPEKKIPKKKEK